ncbi:MULTISPECIES: hypothetical protein [unclassified Brevundimonas]|uniref:hypothetical protein n=1 Tax=unclassified Brevundimonas TaxID=2622653 RepID=UPI0025C7336A|nr:MULTISPECIES: hypothetical protein [unclassified Brevundimonas]
MSEQLAPLDMALSEAPDAVEARANSGDGQAQLAMSIVSRYGLHGRTPDIVAAGRWRDQALANQRFMPITQYTAAFNGSPSRVNIINVPVQAISAAQWQAVNRCVIWLSGDPAVTSAACGGPAEAERRKVAWATFARGLHGSRQIMSAPVGSPSRTQVLTRYSNRIAVFFTPGVHTSNPPVEASWKHPARKSRQGGGSDHDGERLVAIGGCSVESQMRRLARLRSS